jgi:RNA polymerase sigma-70 factor, ECF subfamily
VTVRHDQLEGTIRSIYSATLDELYGVVSRSCGGDRDLAEDVIQETWLRAVRSWGADGIPDRPMAWLMTVAKRVLANHFRRKTPESFDGREEVIGSTSPEENLREERRSLVDRALRRLPGIQGRLLEAFHLDRRSIAALAHEHHLSERAVEGRLRRARQNLRREIEADEGDPS